MGCLSSSVPCQTSRGTNQLVYIKYHATRDYVRQKLIIPKRVPTHDNISDCLTKALELADWNNVGMRMKGYAPIWPYNRL